MRNKHLAFNSLLLATLLSLAVASSEAEEVRRQFTGEVKAVDVSKRAILVQVTPKLDVGAEVDDSTTISVGGRKASLADVKVGDRVELEYVRNGRVVAKTIRVLSRGEAAQ